MRRIYSEAKAVTVWLGKVDKHSRMAIPLIIALAGVSSSDEIDLKEWDVNTFLEWGTLQDSDFFSKMGMAPPTSTDCKFVRSFFSRAWFHCLWTVQELVIGSSESEVFLICGDEQITWGKMRDFLAFAVDRGWSPTLSSRERFLSPEFERGFVFGVVLSSTVGPIYRAEYQPDVSDSITAWLNYAFGCHNEASFL
jgi:hypothetical protein